jgi:small subunit ribosomal protein S5
MARENDRDTRKHEEPEFEEHLVFINRCAKTTKGGRRMSFSATLVVGDKKGRVGVGTGKAAEVPEAIRKAKQAAEKHLITVALDENQSIPHDYVGTYGSAEVLLKRSKEGTGIIAGGPARSVCELAGIRNIRTKSLGSNNKQNVVLATLTGLAAIRTPEQVSALRNKPVEEL